MKTKTKSILKLAVTAMAIFIMLMGCAHKKAEAPTCPLPSGKLVDNAFNQARNTLEHPVCRYQFDAVFSTLLTIAEGDPKPENNQKFSDLLVWAKDEGIISTIQAQNYYNRYFTHIFISLPDDYKTCNYCPRLKTIMSDCRDELRNKEQGLLKVCKDRGSYAKASGDFQTIELILEATCSACAEE
ncbi:MAG: hypothetical protein GY859_44625 [Desulfobacterales bacterium]|nr:hypothetical protein [Desulfobacterales bacterium]